MGGKIMKLFCLPYAGGAKNIYYKWIKAIDEHIKIEGIELKGRGIRYGEGFYVDFEEAVEDIYINIKNKIQDDDYAIFGHSMGSLLSFELYYKILENGGKLPKHMFFSAYRAPHIVRTEEPIHNLPDDEFIKEVIALGGTPKEVAENKELCELVTPILRNDFRILELYKYKEKTNPIECDITVLNGKYDKLNVKDINGWKIHSSKHTRIINFEGNHFFINSNMDKIINTIEETLLCDSIQI
ncbi:thioesterase II family protein [Clostridium felsineum]|nr:thioesterase II family protein [Clostridium felsineum]